MINVHIIANSKTDPEVMEGLRAILQSHSGPMQFHFPETPTQTVVPGELKVFSNEQEFANLKRAIPSGYIDECSAFEAESMIDPEISKYKFPVTKEVQKWKDLFEECNTFRDEHHIQADDHVILLTPEFNESNWFGGADENANNYFIHTVGWNFYLGGSASPQFPMAYECAVWILRRKMFNSLHDAKYFFHYQARGCMMDFCENKMDITIKLRTADICRDCLNLLIERNVDRTLIKQTMRIMDSIRSFTTFRQRYDISESPSKLEVRGHLQRIVLADMGSLQLDLNPKERSVYLLFLNHPEGIRLSHLDEHREELSNYYRRFSNIGEASRIETAIQLLLNPLEGNLNQVMSRIKSKWIKAVGPEIAKHYLIQGAPGEAFKIALNRELVNWMYND